jgi:protein TonB
MTLPNFSVIGNMDHHAVRRLSKWIACSAMAHVLAFAGIGLRPGFPPNAHALQAELRIEPSAKGLAPQEVTEQLRPSEATRSVTHIPAIIPANDNTPPVAVPREEHALAELLLDVYFASNEVDSRAEPVNEVTLVYPLFPFERKMSGKVIISVFINERGGIDKLYVTSAAPPGYFEDAAIKAVSALEFHPAFKDGVPVKNRKTIEIVFDPDDESPPARPVTPAP